MNSDDSFQVTSANQGFTTKVVVGEIDRHTPHEYKSFDLYIK